MISGSNFAEQKDVNDLRKAFVRYKGLIISASKGEELAMQDKASNNILTF